MGTISLCVIRILQPFKGETYMKKVGLVFALGTLASATFLLSACNCCNPQPCCNDPCGHHSGYMTSNGDNGDNGNGHNGNHNHNMKNHNHDNHYNNGNNNHYNNGNNHHKMMKGKMGKKAKKTEMEESYEPTSSEPSTNPADMPTTTDHSY